MADGYVYTLDESKFEEYGVIAYDREIEDDDGEHEVSIRANDLGNIPQEIIISKRKVEPT